MEQRRFVVLAASGFGKMTVFSILHPLSMQFGSVVLFKVNDSNLNAKKYFFKENSTIFFLSSRF
jgi:ABC-type dipeptide/oligopeptide/nickel transport system ATPase subunit